MTNLQLVEQNCTGVTVAFDDRAVADFFDEQVDQGLTPEQFARIWIHTHPGNSPQPSSVDEETFARVFGRTDWAVMFILACGGRTYARLQFSAGPGGAMRIPTQVDFSLPFAASDEAAWEAEYLAKVHSVPDRWTVPSLTASDSCSDRAQIQPVSNEALLLRAAAGEVHEDWAANEWFNGEDHWYDF